MKIRTIQEPELIFGNGSSVDPKEGIRTFLPNDLDRIRPTFINIGYVGPQEATDLIVDWFNKSSNGVEAKESNKKKLFQSFPGFNSKIAFFSEIQYDTSYVRYINNSDLDKAISENENLGNRITAVVNQYLTEIKFLAKNKNPHVIICVLPEYLVSTLLEQTDEIINEDMILEEAESLSIEEGETVDEYETNFRRLLKAESLKFGVPIQIVRDRILKSSGEVQDQATIAWNLFSAIYYKAGGTPWSMPLVSGQSSCYAGISFYRSRDFETLQTSIAQIFNEFGNGVILRGEPVTVYSEDRSPHLSKEEAYQLLDNAIKEYKIAVGSVPSRLVLHKTSSFSQDEIDGLVEVCKDKHGIMSLDLVTVRSSNDFRIYRNGLFPPRRGTHMEIDKKRHILYTKGSVDLYKTFVGKYPPAPLEIEIYYCDTSSSLIVEEILALTKMNWNNMNFEKKWPITIECSRKVGDVLKYLNEGTPEQQKYSYYM